MLPPCDVQSAAGPLQACAGHEAGCEAAVHVTKEMYALEESEASLLVDAVYAFNNINHQAALHHNRVTCQAMSTMLKNTIHIPV